MKKSLTLPILVFTLTLNQAFADISCPSVTENEVAHFFDNWNDALKSGDPDLVVKQYDQDAVLLPTLSNKIRLTQEERLDYFKHFMENKPVGKIDTQIIKIGCNQAFNTGYYTFTFADHTSISARFSYSYRFHDGQWWISSHHSSLMPEK